MQLKIKFGKSFQHQQKNNRENPTLSTKENWSVLEKIYRSDTDTEFNAI